jgi:hypothetical protein
MKQTVIKYMIPKEVIFEDGDDLGKRIVETAKQLRADTYHHVKMIDEENKKPDQSYHRVTLQRDFTGSAAVWILADDGNQALAIAKENQIFSKFETDNAENHMVYQGLEMHEVDNSDRTFLSGNVSQDDMPDLILELRERGEEIFLDQDIIDRDDGG